MTNTKWSGTSPADPIEDILRRLSAVESYANDLERRLANLDSPQPIARVDPVSYLNPYEGQRAIDPADEQHMWYSNGKWRKARLAAVYHIKVFKDTQLVAAGDSAFIWAIEEDIAGMFLGKVEADVTTASSSGIVQCQLRNIDNGNVDMLSTRVQIDATETHSRTAATAAVVNTSNDDVSHGDRLSIDVDAAGTGAKGLGFVARFLAPIP